MKRQEWNLLYLVILAMVVVGGFTFGVPTLTLAYAALALACPPMLIFMPGGAAAAPERSQHRRPPPAHRCRQVATLQGDHHDAG
jgi:hypothetical protein